MPFCGFLIVQLLDQGLRLFPYPPKASDVDSEEQLASPPVGVSVTLPNDVLFLETPHVARWDEAGSVPQQVQRTRILPNSTTNVKY